MIDPVHEPQNSKPTQGVLVLVGPTASGKTSLSILLATLLDGEIISADSRQIYRYMDIGTAKSSVEQRTQVKHYFVDEFDPDQDFNAGEYGKRGRAIIDSMLKRGKRPIVVGGSGLYIQAVIDGLFEGPSAEIDIRRKLNQRLHDEGAGKLLEELRTFDPESASRMLPSHTRRIIRAIEVYYETGIPISQLQQHKISIEFMPCFVGLNCERVKLYQRIDVRVEKMLSDGFLDEVRRLQERGFDKSLNAFQTVCYKEAFDYLDGKITYDRMVELMKQNTRRYAKRQLTWFRRDERITWFESAEEHQLLTVVSSIAEYFSKFVSMYI